MRVLVDACFETEELKQQFITLVTNALGEMCGGHSVHSTELPRATIICCYPGDAPISAEPDQGEMPVELPAELPIEAPAMDLPGMEIAVELPPIEPTEIPPVSVDPLAQVVMPTEPVAEPVPVEPMECRIISLNMSHTIQCVKVEGPSKLMTGAAGINDGRLTFWYGGVEFFMPAADESMKSSVKNPDHQILPNTIRILVNCNGEEFPIFADVEGSSDAQTECLMLGTDIAG